MSAATAAHSDSSARPPECADSVRVAGPSTGAATRVAIPGSVGGRPRSTEYFPPHSRPAAPAMSSGAAGTSRPAPSQGNAITGGPVEAAGRGTSGAGVPESCGAPVERYGNASLVERDKSSSHGSVVDRIRGDGSVSGRGDEWSSHGGVVDRDRGERCAPGRCDMQTVRGAMAGRNSGDSGAGSGRSSRRRVPARGGADERSRAGRVRTVQEDARAAHNRQGYRIRRRRTA